MCFSGLKILLLQSILMHLFGDSHFPSTKCIIIFALHSWHWNWMDSTRTLIELTRRTVPLRQMNLLIKCDLIEDREKTWVKLVKRT